MRRLWLSTAILSTLLLGATSVQAQTQADYVVSSWPSAYRPTPIEGGGPRQAVDLSANSGGIKTGVPLPFPFTYYGNTFNTVHIGGEGLVSFGGYQPFAPDNGTPAIPDAKSPNNLIAPWWSKDTWCGLDANPAVHTQVIGTAPNRRFVVEWHCNKYQGGHAGSNPSNTSSQFQLWLAEGSFAIQFRYGKARLGTAGDYVRGVTMGIEGPQGTDGVPAPGREGTCENKCTLRNDFPEFTTTQLGLSPGVDFTGSVAGTVGASSGGNAQLTATMSLRNLADQPSPAVDYDLFLSPTPSIPADATPLRRVSHAAPIAPGGVQEIATALTFPEPANGTYHLCARIDPEAKLDEFNRDNDEFCSEPLFFGPVFTAKVTSVPAAATAGEQVNIGIEIQNIGTRAGANVPYHLYLAPRPTRSAQDELVYEAQLSLQPGAKLATTLGVTIPYRLPGLEHYVLLAIDPREEAPLADRSASVGASASTIRMRLPDVVLDDFSITTPNGCSMGQPVIAKFRVCNEGEVDAVGFTPIVYFTRNWNANLFEDAPVVSQPEICDAGTDCTQPAAVCVEGGCRLPCSTNADCGGAGLTCERDPDLSGATEVRSCQQRLAVGACRNIQLQGTIPLVDAEGVPYGEGDHRFFAVGDGLELLNQGKASAPVYSEAFACKPPVADLVAAALSAQTRMSVGGSYQMMGVIQNVGLAGAVATRSYFLSPLPFLSARSIPLVLETPQGLSVAAGGARTFTDRVRIPSHLASGTYYLALAVDPSGEVPDLDRANNVRFLDEEVVVEGAALRIETLSLPAAVLGGNYVRQLAASGGAGAYAWSGEGLPPGLQLRPDGLLHGSPTETGVFTPVVFVDSAGSSAHRMLVLEVNPPMGPLHVATAQLPVAVIGKPYQAQLAAGGGAPPYDGGWQLASGRLPSGLLLDASGDIRGTPASIAKSESFVVSVQDARGNRAERQFTLAVSPSEDLRIHEEWLDDATARESFLQCLQAAGGSGGEGYRWHFEASSLPPGLSGDENSGCLSGQPLACGSFLVEATVEDAAGASFVARLPFTVACAPLRLDNPAFPPLQRGEAVDLELTSNGGAGTRMRLHAGKLPAGLELDLAGKITGQVAEDARLGAHAFVVELRDDEGGRGLEALLLQVEGGPAPAPKKKGDDGGGCSASGASGPGLATLLPLALLGAGLLRRRARLLLPVLALCLAAGCQSDDDGGADKGACAKVECGDNPYLTCDPADGLCKCGGVLLCDEGEACLMTPGPTCVSTRCEDVRCEAGTACDPADGVCKCAGALCEEGEVCWDGLCLLAQGCSGVICPAGSACDPADGTCKCGDTACAEDERCTEAGCEPDPCYGQNCGPNAACNPDDGLCHCGGPTGPVCAGGESCVAVSGGQGFVCAAEDRCKDAHCEGGTVCDPRSGACKCGGLEASAPVCGPGQTCNDGVCLGGDQCTLSDGSPVVCEGGLSCDPLDGLCKCGGMGGIACEAGQVCISDPEGKGGLSCATPCELLAEESGCPALESCYFDAEQPAAGAFCAAPGYLVPGSTCSYATECDDGLHCATTLSGSVCRAYCKVSAPGRCQFCAPLRGAPQDVGVCMD